MTVTKESRDENAGPLELRRTALFDFSLGLAVNIRSLFPPPWASRIASELHPYPIPLAKR